MLSTMLAPPAVSYIPSLRPPNTARPADAAPFRVRVQIQQPSRDLASPSTGLNDEVSKIPTWLKDGERTARSRRLWLTDFSRPS